MGRKRALDFKVTPRKQAGSGGEEARGRVLEPEAELHPQSLHLQPPVIEKGALHTSLSLAPRASL